MFNGYGTLGSLCRDASDGTPMALSNWHVWAHGGERGDDIIQPAHPRAGEHLEGLGKVAACGPILTSVIEGRAPSPLASGMYGGAAAAATAAALSDYRDPIRRGQDATPPGENEQTERESVEVSVEYPDLPWPGTPFATDVDWTYERHTDRATHTHEVSERRHNAQFLLGQYVGTDSRQYSPGDTVEFIAAIWDYQDRPADAYHVVAHVVPDDDADDATQVVLHPTECPKSVPIDPPDDEDQLTCIDFAEEAPGTTYAHKRAFEWLNVLSIEHHDLRIVDWHPASGDGDGELAIPRGGLEFSHQPASRVRVRVAQFTNEPVSITAYTSDFRELDSATGRSEQGTVQELTVEGDSVVVTRVEGGGGEGVVLSYCIDPERSETTETGITEELADGVLAERSTDHLLPDNRLQGHRRCFRGEIGLSPTAPEGTRDVYLNVQNVNHVAADEPPEEAATVIGGHIVGTSSSVTGCTAIMLADHAFDVI